MSAKEKAIELVGKFKLKPIRPFFIMEFEHSKQCALIAVDEVIENSHTKVFTNYWQEVKNEIEKL